ncbi:MAG: hypothetical protein GY739_00240 [Mesoflavibacter sp.]|nr:hypothetical protein [Mesoflavibacter sp.]
MKTFFTKILSLFLAAFILLSTTSFTANMHFCCDKLVDIAFFSKAEACKDKVQKKDSPFKKCTTLQEKDCCVNQTILKEASDTFKKSNPVIEVDTLVFLNTFVYSYINLFEGLDKNTVPFEAYRPPLLSKEIHILHETYLI